MVAVLLVPGLAVGAVAGLRGWLLVGSAPVLTYGIVAVGGPLTPTLFGGWSVWMLALWSGFFCLAGAAVRLVSKRSFGLRRVDTGIEPNWLPRHHAGVALLVVATTAVGLYVTGAASNHFANPHQFWDAVFHANAARFIADTGLSDPSALRAISEPANANFFYPNGYHIELATSLQLTGVDLVRLLNLHAGLLAGLFGLSLVTLLRAAGARPVLVASVAILSAAFTSFPYGLEYFGPVWPFATGVAVLSGFVALFVATLNGGNPTLVFCTALGAVGLVGLHPSVAISAAILCAAFLAQRWITARLVPRRELMLLVAIGMLAAINATSQLISSARSVTESGVDWPTDSDPGSALGRLLFLNLGGPWPQWWLVVVAVLGLVGIRALRTLSWWLLGGLVFVALYTASASYNGRLAELLTAPWWNDRWRLAALSMLPMVLLAANGMVVARDLLLKAAFRVRRGTENLAWVRSGALAVVVLALVVLTNGLYINRNRAAIYTAYADWNQGLTVTERTAIDELAKLVGNGQLVMNDPSDGSAWMLALTGIRPVFGHVVSTAPAARSAGMERATLYQSFNELDTNPDIQHMVRDLHITYVFAGVGKVYGNDQSAPGMSNLDSVASLRLVYANGCRIYRIDLPEAPGEAPKAGS